VDSVSSLEARAFLLNFQLDATARSLTLQAVLNEALTDAVEAGKGGTVLTQQSGNGHTYQLAVDAGLSPSQYRKMIAEFLKLRSECEVALISEGVSSPTDAQLVNDMLRYVDAAPTEFVPDFSGAMR
jgi:hypothetical protein